MVKELPTTVKLHGAKLRFARALAQGATQATAYKLATGSDCSPETANVQGCRWAQNPLVKSKVNELQSEADLAASLRLTERRALLAGIARQDPNRPPTHSERISAIKTDAELSGDLRRDDQSTAHLSINLVLASLGPPVVPPTIDVTPSPPSSSESTGGQGGTPITSDRVAAMGGQNLAESPEGVFTIAQKTPQDALAGD